MKTLTTLLIASATAFSLNVSADVNGYLGGDTEAEYLYNEVNNFQEVRQVTSVDDITYFTDNEYKYNEQFENNGIASILNDLENSPPASGGSSINGALFLGERADEEYKQ